jgi:hypothetical protein
MYFDAEFYDKFEYERKNIKKYHHHAHPCVLMCFVQERNFESTFL